MDRFWNDHLAEGLLIVTIFAIIFATFLLAWVLKISFKRFVEGNEQVMKDDPTNYKFLYYTFIALIYIVGFGFAMWHVPFLRHVAQSMLAGAGILAIVIGFASQQALGNIISGVFIVMFKPYRINDRISLKDSLRGVVEDINLRHTIIRNFENQRIIIPNSVMSNEILTNSNYNDDKICRFIEVGISYGSDIDVARRIMQEEIYNHPLCIDVRKEADIEAGIPRVTVRVLSLNDSSVTLRGWAWAADAPNAFVLQCDVTESIKKRFDKEGIVIPFPQRTLSYLDKPSPATISQENDV